MSSTPRLTHKPESTMDAILKSPSSTVSPTSDDVAIDLPSSFDIDEFRDIEDTLDYRKLQAQIDSLESQLTQFVQLLKDLTGKVDRTESALSWAGRDSCNDTYPNQIITLKDHGQAIVVMNDHNRLIHAVKRHDMDDAAQWDLIQGMFEWQKVIPADGVVYTWRTFLSQSRLKELITGPDDVTNLKKRLQRVRELLLPALNFTKKPRQPEANGEKDLAAKSQRKKQRLTAKDGKLSKDAKTLHILP